MDPDINCCAGAKPAERSEQEAAMNGAQRKAHPCRQFPLGCHSRDVDEDLLGPQNGDASSWPVATLDASHQPQIHVNLKHDRRFRKRIVPWNGHECVPMNLFLPPSALPSDSRTQRS